MKTHTHSTTQFAFKHSLIEYHYSSATTHRIFIDLSFLEHKQKIMEQQQQLHNQQQQRRNPHAANYQPLNFNGTSSSPSNYNRKYN